MVCARPIESVLGPASCRFHDAHPFVDHDPRTEEHARLLVADALASRALDIHLEPATAGARISFMLPHGLAKVGPGETAFAELPALGGQAPWLPCLPESPPTGN